MRQLPSRLRRLDDALAALPLEEPMLLTELDGFLTGVLLCPERIPASEWLEAIWGIDEDGTPPFDDPTDMRWFTDAVHARAGEIARDLDRGKPQPLLDTDPRNGDMIWEPWIAGFGEAMALRPDSWTEWADGDDRETADTLAQIGMLIAVAHDESPLDSMAINAIHDRAAGDLTAILLHLHAARPRDGGIGPALPDAVPKPGRNDPCACGSGRKFKRCCG